MYDDDQNTQSKKENGLINETVFLQSKFSPFLPTTITICFLLRQLRQKRRLGVRSRVTEMAADDVRRL